MNRRQVMMLPGVALLAQQASAQVARVSTTRSRPVSQRVSHKVLLKYDRPKAISKIPKNENKVAKYLSSLNALLGHQFGSAAAGRGDLLLGGGCGGGHSERHEAYAAKSHYRHPE